MKFNARFVKFLGRMSYFKTYYWTIHIEMNTIVFSLIPKKSFKTSLKREFWIKFANFSLIFGRIIDGWEIIIAKIRGDSF